MVTDETERDSTPHYSLDRIRELAAGGHVSYGSSRVWVKIECLGYSPEDVYGCLANLNADDYSESIKYPNQPFWLDVYHCCFISSNGGKDELYIKLKLTKNCLTIVLASFHLKDSYA